MNIAKVNKFLPIKRNTVNRLYLQFSYRSFSFIEGGELYEFIPSDETFIIIDKKKGIFENLSSTFAFRRNLNNHVLHLKLEKLLEITDLGDCIADVFKEVVIPKKVKVSKKDIDVTLRDNVRDAKKDIIDTLVNKLEKQNAIRLLWKGIDEALDNGNKEQFEKLSKELNNLLTNDKNNDILSVYKTN